MIRAREGAEAARQRFAPVRPGPRPGTPLQLVQAGHTRVDLVLVDAVMRHGHTVKVLTEMLGTNPRRCGHWFRQTLEPDCARELKDQLLAAGLPA